MSLRRVGPLVLAVTLAAAACDNDGSTDPDDGLTISVQAGDNQLAGPGSVLPDPLQVVVEHDGRDESAPRVTVHWSIIEGTGAELATTQSVTDETGLASNTMRLGPTLGTYRVQATVEGLTGEPAVFTMQAVQAATIASVSPEQVEAGDTVTILGSDFSVDAAGNTVLFAGLQGVVVESSATRLRVVVPACVPTRLAGVRVLLGDVSSNTVTIQVEGSGESLSLGVGEALTLADPSAMSCLRLPAQSDASYLLVLQNGADVSGQRLDVRLAAAAAEDIAVAATSGPLASRDGGRAVRHASVATVAATAQESFEESLRDAERRLVREASRGAGQQPGTGVSAAAVNTPPPEVGDRREFWVFSGPNEFERITARVEYVSDHAVLYQDLNAPAGGFTAAEFQRFGELFDDPIYPTAVDVYGAPSDVDANGHVIILFTPVVNLLTPPGSGEGFVAGFFFGIDLLDEPEHSNHAEVFYTLVPDPEGEFGNERTFQQMLQGVPPVLAHEFQHMIHFNQRVLLRDVAQEASWLAEGLAHTAEELIGDVYLSRGMPERAFEFKVQNYLRAASYLESPESVGLIEPDADLPVRGAAWLLLEYLRQHHGGNSLLTALTQTTTSSVANVTGTVTLPWETILSRWGTTLYTDDLGIPGIDPIYTMPELDLRDIFQSRGYPLVPDMLPFDDFVQTATLPASTSAYFVVNAGADPPRLNIVVGRRAGGPFTGDATPLLTLMRLR